ncbi:MAG TPA: hypothetical protein VHX38_29785 [Pseudonocardiaceae bacterium]|nr:hypothetical protein [Pseudonocardiaceae bacterium]
MTEPDSTGPVRYAEIGSTWWPVAWGPIFALAGAGLEALTGPVHVLGWLVVGLALAIGAIVWVQARRRVCSVRLTADTLYQGREGLPVDRIAEIEDVGSPLGARVLGGGWTVPKRFAELPLRLRDDSVVLAWARNPDALRAALRPLVGPWEADTS